MVFINQCLYEWMFLFFVFFVECLSGDKIGIDKCYFIGIFYCKINVLSVVQCDFIVVRIL